MFVSPVQEGTVPVFLLRAVMPGLGPVFPGAIPWNPLFLTIMVIAALVVLLVAVLVGIVVLRSRNQPPDRIPDQDFGNRRLEIGWTVAPTAIVIGVFGLTLWSMTTGPRPDTDVPPGQQPDIEVIGHQWWWEIRYPGAGVVTANVLRLPVGRPILVTLQSADVQHNFWVPELGQKMDMYPGKVNHTWLEADQPGVYQGVCAEFCGTQHAWMRILAVALPEAEFDAWLLEQQTPAPQPTEPLAQQGLQVYQQRTCGSCHFIAGLPGAPPAGATQAAPDLTHFASRPTISAGVLENTPENLALYLENPQAVKPGIFMPNFRLTDDEIAALVAYLETLE